MSIFTELILPKILDIQNGFVKNINDDLKAALESIDKFEEEFINGKSRAPEKTAKDKSHVTLQSIQEDGGQTKTSQTNSKTSLDDESSDSECRGSKKRSKNEVDGMSSPEQEKRLKRNASVKAQGIISKQVNVNLTQKMRRENSIEKSKCHRQKGEDKENAEPVPIVLKQRKNYKKDKLDESDDETSRRRTTRTRKQTDTAPAAASSRSTRSMSRNTKPTENEDDTEARPKRTRGKKVPPETDSQDTTEDGRMAQDSGGSPAEKPRPKRTRRGQKAAEEKQKTCDAETPSVPRELLQREESPILQKVHRKTKPQPAGVEKIKASGVDQDSGLVGELETTHVISRMDGTVILDKNLDKTVVLPNCVYAHVPVNPQNIRNMNETVVIETCRTETAHAIMDTTVVIDKATKPANVTEDNSLMTDDESGSLEMSTPPPPPQPPTPLSAVKSKVQQFEEMASRVTRTKTRALVNKDDELAESRSPPERAALPIPAEQLAHLNSIIFNGKPPQTSQSATRFRCPTQCKPVSASASKISAASIKAREMEDVKREREDARRKKEAMLEAKRELQKRKREDKMAAAAAAREAAEKERRAALNAAARERQEKQMHADMGKMEKLKLVEKKKQELARKVQETEERRRAEELARHQRLEEEQKRAEANRKKQMLEAEATKKEAALMAREIERRQREFHEKQKLKPKFESRTPVKGKLPPIEPVYMEDGFQYLNSDEEADVQDPPTAAWSSSKARSRQLAVQARLAAEHVDKLFSVREHAPDLREIFPNIERAHLKRTSSAVWRTPPPLAAVPE